MNDRHDKDARLAEDIRLLGRLLGDTIRAYEGEKMFERVEEIYQRGLRGLVFAYNARPPRALPATQTLTYFQVNRESSLDEWKNVQDTLKLAIRLNEKLVAGNIEGQKSVTIRTEGQTASMQFTLFVVPQALASS